jgi:hypothetical protein
MRRVGLWCIVLLVCLLVAPGTFSWATPSDVEDVADVTGLVAFTTEANYMSLPGYLRWQYFIDHQEWITMLEAFLAVKAQGINPAWPAWKTIQLQLGTYKSNETLRQALVDAGFKINDEVHILNQVEMASEPTKVDLVVVSIAELGFPNGASIAQIYEKALSLGLELCPAEVGPQFRLQYPDQPNGEWILVAMEPILDSFGNHDVFRVIHGHPGLWLTSFFGDPETFFCSSESRWAFRYK